MKKLEKELGNMKEYTCINIAQVMYDKNTLKRKLK